MSTRKTRSNTSMENEVKQSKKSRLPECVVLLRRCDQVSAENLIQASGAVLDHAIEAPVVASEQILAAEEMANAAMDLPNGPSEIAPKKERKKHDAVVFEGHTFHRSSSVNGGETIYLDCAG